MSRYNADPNAFQKPNLIQRLTQPTRSDNMLAKVMNAFSFGGGLVNGGFTKEARELLHQIFEFDYMGSSEFEWGAVPKAFANLVEFAKKGEIVCHSFEIDRSEHPTETNPDRRVVPYWKKLANGNTRKRYKKIPMPTGKQKVWVICRKGHEQAVEAFILNDWAKPYDRSSYYLKESTMFCHAVDPVNDYVSRTKGWIELDNPFMYFISKEMYDGMRALLGFEEAEKAEVKP